MTTPQPAALPEKLIFSERLAISEAAQVPMDAECCRVIQATLDYISSNYALAALQPQPAAAVSDEEIVAALEAAGVKFQRFMGGITGTKDCWSTAGSQDVRKLLAGVRAILALRPQAVPMTDDTARLDWIAEQFGDVLLLEMAKDLPRDDMPFREAIDHLRGITAPAGGEKQA